MQWRSIAPVFSFAISPIVIAIAILFGLITFTLYLQFVVPKPVHPVAIEGNLSLSSAATLPVPLNGQWHFYWQALLAPDELTGEYHLATVPSRWRHIQLAEQVLGAPGYATYALTVQLSEPAKDLGLRIPLLYRAAKLWVNGDLLAEVGRPGDSLATEIPRDEIKLVPLPDGATELQLVLQLSSFHHIDGGISHPLILDQWSSLQRAEHWRMVRGAALMASTMTLALYLLVMWGYGGAGRAYLLLGAGLFFYAVRLFGKERLIFYLYPDFSVEWLLRSVYYGMYLCVPAYMLFIQAFFPRDINKRLLVVFAWVGVAGVLVTTFTPSYIYTRLRDPYEPYALAMMTYFLLCLIRIVWLRRQWSGVVAFLGGVSILLFINESLYLRGLINIQLSPLAYVLVALTSLLFLGQRMNAQLLSESEQSARLQQAVAAQTTELEQRVRELDQARRHAVELAQKRHTFIATLSHEIRTPLSGMLGAIRLLGNPEKTIDNERLQGYALEAGETLLAVVNQSLDSTTLERQPVLSLSCQQPATGFNAVAYIMGLSARDKGLEFHYQPPEGSHWVLADFQRLRQVVANLLSNAIKYTSAGQVQLSVSLYTARAPDNPSPYEADYTLVIAVTDSGCGIAHEHYASIFAAYVQLQNEDFDGAGTGLGLTICRQLVELHGGHIDVESQPEKGSRFVVTLPVNRCEPVSAQPLPEAAVEVQSLSILVVEDDALNRTVVTELLHQLGHRVVATASPEQALRHIAAGPFDALMLDIRLPEMSGLELLTRARRLVSEAQVPLCVALTANTSQEDLQRYRQAGFDCVLEKPIEQAQLACLLSRADVRSLPQEHFLVRHPASVYPPGDEVLVDWRVWKSIVTDLGEQRAEGLLQAAQQSMFDSLQTLEQALAQADWQNVGEMAHKLKSAARSVGLLQVARLAEAMETEPEAAADYQAPMRASVREGLRQLSISLHSRHNPSP